MTKRRARPKPKPKTQPGLDRILTGEVVGGALVVERQRPERRQEFPEFG
jgi:hypothetical protein